MEYGLIGKTLKHSFSKLVHEALTDYGYELYPLPTEEEFHHFMQERNFRGINVTIPYKQDVIPYCESLDEKAKAIGAVNTIVNRQGKLYGYNTDFDGFLYQCQQCGIVLRDKNILILGTGGTFRTVSAVAREEGAKNIFVASRRAGEGLYSYEQVVQPDFASQIQVIINTSPVGMYPNNQDQVLSLSPFKDLTGVVDVVYNPLSSNLILEAKERKIPASGGLPMLVAQAKFAAEYFSQTTIPDQSMEKVLCQIGRKQSNLVLIGMPACGKSTLGRNCAKIMGRQFVDLDEALSKKAGKTIPELFAQEGEEVFRQLETEICQEYGKQNGLVLSTGGGVVTREGNIQALSQNGVFVYITRPLEQLDIGKNRPLSQSRDDLAQLFAQREPLYKKTAHCTIENNDMVHIVGKRIQEAYYEIFNTQWS